MSSLEFSDSESKWKITENLLVIDKEPDEDGVTFIVRFNNISEISFSKPHLFKRDQIDGAIAVYAKITHSISFSNGNMSKAKEFFELLTEKIGTIE